MSNPLERERIEILRDLKRVISQIMEHQHDQSYALTEDDPAVLELLVWVERSLWHGLRKVLLNEPTLQHITLWNVVTYGKLRPLSPNSGSTADKEDRDYLEFCKLKQTVQELDLKSGSGKSRAWTRLALNHGLLDVIMSWLQEGHDVNTFYEPVSLWRATEQRAILLALFASLRGMRFNLEVKLRLDKLDNDPEPSRRPHFLGISSMKRTPSSSLPVTASTGGAMLPPAQQAQQQKEREEVLVLKSKLKSPALQSSSQPSHPPPSPPAGVMSWFKDALFGPAPPSASTTEFTKPISPPIPPPPSFLGSTLTALTHDKRTGDEYCLLNNKLCVPRALSSLLAIISMDDTKSVLEDLFDPRHVALEDDPKFVKEVSSLLSRLSSRKRKDNAELFWDGGPPSLVAVSCLRLFFRQLPEPVIPFDSYDALCSCQQIGEEDAKIRNISFLIDSIPDSHKPTLVAVLEVVREKIDSGQTSYISAANSLAPSLVRPRPEYGSFAKSGEGAELVLLFLEHFNDIFGPMVSRLEVGKTQLQGKIARVKLLDAHFKQAVNWNAQDEYMAKRLWIALAPEQDTNMFAPISDGWLMRGFRTTYFASEFRGCGFTALENIVYLCEQEPELARELLKKFQPSPLPTTSLDKSSFPFIAGSAQISFMVCEFLGVSRMNPLVDVKQVAEWQSIWPLHDEDQAVGKLFVLVLRYVSQEWTNRKVKAMEFNKFIREVRITLEDILEQYHPQTVDALQLVLLGGEQPTRTMVSPPSIVVTTKDLPSSVMNVVTPIQGLDADLIPRLLCPFKTGQDGALFTLSEVQISTLETALPAEFRGYDWELVFSSTVHGFNLPLFFQLAQPHETTILAVQDVSLQVFGAFCNEHWRPNADVFYGSAQTFLWSSANQQETTPSTAAMEVFKWTQANNFFMLSNDDCLALGQGGEHNAFGIYIDGDLNRGTSGPSGTFGNDKPLIRLGDGEELMDEVNAGVTCKVIELWAFVPKTVAKRRE
ncbi:hypothetical protein BASA81_006719 [Batrachochytrium salamandrivorans]|nr:hypothetical protein BASA81_006719 [Batrachochytrium salamandrivorans]